MSLRNKLIRLAYEQPQLRSDILPLITKSAMEHATPEARDKYLDDHPNADPSNHTVKKQDSGSSDNGGFKSKADLESKIDTLEDEIDDLKDDIKYDIMDIEYNIDDYVSGKKKIQEDFQRYYSKGDITKEGDNISTLLDSFTEDSFYKLENWPEIQEGYKEVKKALEKAEKDTGQASAKPYLDRLKKMFSSMARDLDYTLEDNEDLAKYDKKLEEMRKLEKLKADWKEPEKKEEPKKEEKSEEKSFADKKKEYEEKIKNSKGMSQKEKDAALKRLKNMSEEDLDKSLSSMGKGRKNKGKGDSDDEESGGKKASLRHQLIRLAYQNPSLRSDILPLITKSAKGDYKKGDKIPSKAVYGSKDSYDEKLKDGKIFVVLPRDSKNSDPYMMYLTDKSLKVLKVLGTHPSLRGAKSWLKSQKGKLASVRRGETWENNNLRVHRYHDSLKVWDLKHAGKRGKNVEIMHIDINDWEKPNPKRAYLDDLANFLTKSTTYDKYKKLVISFLETAGFSDVVGGRNSVVSFTSEKGVRISPPNMGKIVINNRFVSAYFELDGFHIQDKTDQYNLPTMMERDRRSPKKLYKFVAGNKELFERMNYKEMYQFLKDYKINFRVYMGMD